MQGRTNTVQAWMPKNGHVSGRGLSLLVHNQIASMGIGIKINVRFFSEEIIHQTRTKHYSALTNDEITFVSSSEGFQSQKGKGGGILSSFSFGRGHRRDNYNEKNYKT